MTRIVLEPPAKVNLVLRVLAREASGYHQLETLFQAIDLRDRLEMERIEEGVELEVTGAELGPLEENLVWRAAAAFRAATRMREGVRLRLDKRIPAAAGLGGGSSDAASTLIGMNRLFDHPLDREAMAAIAGGLGSDVPYFFCPSPLALGWGRGDRLLPLPPLPEAPLLLALPAIRIGTREAYGSLAALREASTSEDDRSRAPRGRILPPGFPRSWRALAAEAENDFEDAIFPQHPILESLRTALADSEALVSLLSGSGSSLFAVYESDEAARTAETTLAGAFPEVRFVLTRTLEASVGDTLPGA